MSDLTETEQKNVRAALGFLRVRCGGLALLAKALRVGPAHTVPEAAEPRVGLPRSETEQKNVRAALGFLRVRCGGLALLAKALRVGPAHTVPEAAEPRVGLP